MQSTAQKIDLLTNSVPLTNFKVQYLLGEKKVWKKQFHAFSGWTRGLKLKLIEGPQSKGEMLRGPQFYEKKLLRATNN